MPPKRERISAHRSLIPNRVRLLCYPLTAAIAFRVIGAVWLFRLLSPQGKFHTPWMDVNPNLWSSLPSTPFTSPDWLWLFNAWDSPHFQLIAMLGYAHPDYVFFPGYPLLIRLAGLLTGNFWFGAFLVTQIFALGSIVVFQLLAEQYMHPKEALHATLLMATFPYISVFTTLSYSEAVFLFSSLSTWYFHKTGRISASSLFAGLASVSRIYGLAIVLPMFLDIMKSKRYRKLLYLAVPAAFIGSWLLYCYLSTGDPFASWTDERYWVYDAKFSLAQTLIIQALRGVAVCCALDPALLISVGLFGYLILRTWQFDRSLWVYALSLFGMVTFAVANHFSLLRFLSFIFPIWLTLKIRNSVIVATCIAFFVPVALILWLYAIDVTFIG